MIKQKTIKKEVEFKGIGLHSGEITTIKLLPSDSNTGIIFRDSFNKNNYIHCNSNNITETKLNTTLENEKFKISTIEHLLCAISIRGIDNIIIEINNSEIPIMDGSAMPFIIMLNEAGIQELSSNKQFIKIKKSVVVKDDDKIASLIPSNSFNINFEIDFDHPFIKNTEQKLSIEFFTEDLVYKISRARTFGFIKDIEFLKSIDLCKGGSIDNAIVLSEYSILNNRLRYKDEFIRHKILDSIGDLYVDGKQILGNFSAFKSGHELNNLLMRSVINDTSNYELIEFENNQVNHIRNENTGSLEIIFDY
jgi:UDP-3-O-[3-hydroxymyristoyl] N-acetylglucosamine deacetylase